RGIVIDFGGLRHKRIDISDADEETVAAVGVASGKLYLIQITGSFVVDRGPEEGTEIFYFRAGGLRSLSLQRLHLGHDFRGELWLKARVQHGLAGASDEIKGGRRHARVSRVKVDNATFAGIRSRDALASDA